MPAVDAEVLNPGGYRTMKMRLIIAGGLLLALSGCATYDYVGGGRDGYYHGAPSTQYRYPAGYPGGYPYGYGSGYYGYGGYGYGYPVYRSYPNYRPPHHGHRPGNGNHRPPDRPRPPTRPPGNNGGSPWRNMDSNTRPRQPSVSRPAPQRQQQARPAQPPRQSTPRSNNGSPWRNMNRRTERKVER